MQRIFRDGALIDRALADGVREALSAHIREGRPAAEWCGDRTVLVDPDELRGRIARITPEPGRPFAVDAQE